MIDEATQLFGIPKRTEESHDGGSMISFGGARAALMRRMWSRRSRSWHDHVTNSAGFDRVRESVLAACELRGDEQVVDLGAGSGFLSLELRQRTCSVLAVDIAPAMLDALQATTQTSGKEVETCVADLRKFDLPSGSVDLVVSSYALHHLSHRDKKALLRRAQQWLRPGGRLIVADMMFGRGGTAQDRRILRQKLSSFAQRGPGGLWRIVKAAYRYGLRLGNERPASPSFWQEAMADAGFAEVRYRSVIAEAGLVTGRKPLRDRPATAHTLLKARIPPP